MKRVVTMDNPQEPTNHENDHEDNLTELMKAHLDDIAGGTTKHNSWKQTY